MLKNFKILLKTLIINGSFKTASPPEIVMLVKSSWQRSLQPLMWTSKKILDGENFYEYLCTLTMKRRSEPYSSYKCGTAREEFYLEEPNC